MKKINYFAITVLIAGLAGACSTASTTPPNTRPTDVSSNTAAANTTANAAHDKTSGDETPESVKAVFPEAQNFTTQHKDIPAATIAEIEKETGGKVPDRDHHSYLAFSTVAGKRTQLGAATVVKTGGKDLIILYENKGGMPTIREVRADGLPTAFLGQFAGKGHDDKFAVGGDLKLNGADEAAARAAALAVRIDSMTMQTLYGAAHTH